MIKEAINTLVNGKDLTDEVMTQVMEEIMTGEATDAQKASFLTALSQSMETGRRPANAELPIVLRHSELRLILSRGTAKNF